MRRGPRRQRRLAGRPPWWASLTGGAGEAAGPARPWRRAILESLANQVGARCDRPGPVTEPAPSRMFTATRIWAPHGKARTRQPECSAPAADLKPSAAIAASAPMRRARVPSATPPSPSAPRRPREARSLVEPPRAEFMSATIRLSPRGAGGRALRLAEQRSPPRGAERGRVARKCDVLRSDRPFLQRLHRPQHASAAPQASSSDGATRCTACRRRRRPRRSSLTPDSSPSSPARCARADLPRSSPAPPTPRLRERPLATCAIPRSAASDRQRRSAARRHPASAAAPAAMTRPPPAPTAGPGARGPAIRGFSISTQSSLAQAHPSFTIGCRRRLREAEGLVEPPAAELRSATIRLRPARRRPCRSASASSRVGHAARGGTRVGREHVHVVRAERPVLQRLQRPEHRRQLVQRLGLRRRSGRLTSPPATRPPTSAIAALRQENDPSSRAARRTPTASRSRPARPSPPRRTRRAPRSPGRPGARGRRHRRGRARADAALRAWTWPQAWLIAPMWRWSVPQQPPSTGGPAARPMQRAVLARQLLRVARVELRRLVELGMAHLRGVRPDPADPLAPGAARPAGSRKCVGCAQFTM